MEKELFSFARIVAKLPPKRNKHYKKDFAHIINDTGEADKLSNVTPILRNDIGLNTLVSDISVTKDITYPTGWVKYFRISFSFAYLDSQLTTPWDVAQDGAITFLLCAKHLGLHKDVALLIAKRVYTNVSLEGLYTFTWNDGIRVTWNGAYWMTNGNRVKGCVNCKYPCEVFRKRLCKVCVKII